MALYVLALTDSRVRRGSTRVAFLNVEIDGIVAICQRRKAVPPATDEALRQQHQDVLDIARQARAVLPVRYGALIGKDELVERIRGHAVMLQRALDDVRDRVQMTLRILGTASPLPAPVASTGRQYLEDRRRALEPVLPEAARTLVAALSPIAVRERREPGAAGLLATIYHLVATADLAAYTATAGRHSVSNIIVSGPWPPFAFTPQNW